MRTTMRFACPSVSLALSALLRKTTGVLWVCVGLGVAIHLSFTAIRSLEAEQQAAKPLTTQFVKRAPRLTKPLELKKRPQPKRRRVQREMVAVRPQSRGEAGAGKIQAFALAGRLARPSVHVSRGVRLETAELEPQAVAHMIEGKKEAENVVDMSLEMMDVDALDTGRYHAMVIQDPTDKRAIKGYLRLGSASPELPEQYAQGEAVTRRAVVRVLVHAVNECTSIKARAGGEVAFDSSELLDLPFLFTRMFYHFTMRDSELSQLGHYLISGGFIYAETGLGRWDIPIFDTGYERIKTTFRDALKAQGLEEGEQWTRERLPNTHPLYHCYFDFDGPPPGAEVYRRPLKTDYDLEAAISKGKVLAILSQKNWGHMWLAGSYLDNTRQLQFGVNLIVFALTQEGSIARRLVDSVR